MVATVAYTVWVAHSEIGWDILFSHPIDGIFSLGEYQRWFFVSGVFLSIISIPFLIVLLILGLDYAHPIIVFGGAIFLLWGIYNEAGIFTCIAVGIIFYAIYFLDNRITALINSLEAPRMPSYYDNWDED